MLMLKFYYRIAKIRGQSAASAGWRRGAHFESASLSRAGFSHVAVQYLR